MLVRRQLAGGSQVGSPSWKPRERKGNQVLWFHREAKGTSPFVFDFLGVPSYPKGSQGGFPLGGRSLVLNRARGVEDGQGQRTFLTLWKGDWVP